MDKPNRLVSEEDQERCVPVYVVWELTLACNLKCAHCGSRAGQPRTQELSTEECFSLIEQLSRLGTREVTIIGGEAFLRSDWLDIIAAIREKGMDCTLQTGGFHLSEKELGKAIDVGLQGIGVSIDGQKNLHDKLRGVPGSFSEALRVLRYCKSRNVVTSVNTQITSQIMPQLHDLMKQIVSVGVKYWQVQLTVAMGNAVDNDEVLLQPYELLELMPLLAQLYKEGQEKDLLLIPGNNIGYFGPYEVLWRGPNLDGGNYAGCLAGQNAIGIEADGTIKGCPSLPRQRYAVGNIRDLSLDDIWSTNEALKFNRQKSVEDLWGFCSSCYYAHVCRGGCTWTADALFERRGNNPYCHYRSLKLAEIGLRERVVKIADAENYPFATGKFKLVEEPLYILK